MKYRLVLLTALAAGQVAAQRPPPEPPQPQASDLRQAVRKYHAAGDAPARQLTPEERAELRKQLAEFNQPRATPNHEAPLEPQPRIMQR